MTYGGLEYLIHEGYSEVMLEIGEVTYRYNDKDPGAQLDKYFIKDIRHDLGVMNYQLHAKDWDRDRNGQRIIHLKAMLAPPGTGHIVRSPRLPLRMRIGTSLN